MALSHLVKLVISTSSVHSGSKDCIGLTAPTMVAEKGIFRFVIAKIWDVREMSSFYDSKNMGCQISICTYL